MQHELRSSLNTAPLKSSGTKQAVKHGMLGSEISLSPVLKGVQACKAHLRLSGDQWSMRLKVRACMSD